MFRPLVASMMLWCFTISIKTPGQILDQWINEDVLGPETPCIPTTVSDPDAKLRFYVLHQSMQLIRAEVSGSERLDDSGTYELSVKRSEIGVVGSGRIEIFGHESEEGEFRCAEFIEFEKVNPDDYEDLGGDR